MTSTAFISCLRFLVLAGLFLANAAHAGPVCTTGNSTGSSPAAACQAWVASANISSPASNTVFISATESTCTYSVSGTQIITNPMQCACDLNGPGLLKTMNLAITSVGQSNSYSYNYAGNNVNQCSDSCSMTFNAAATALDAASNGSNADQYCTTIGAPVVGQTAACSAVFKPNGGVCNLPSSPNPTPACPSGQTRATFGAACSPIQCSAPLVKVGDKCEIPVCPSGQSYEYSNGSGSCVKNPTPCIAPQTMVNGICTIPTCKLGTTLAPNGSCILDATTNGTTSGSGTGTGTGSGTGSGTSGTGTGSGTSGTGTGTTGTDGKGGSTTGTGSAAGTSTNTSGSGTCTTPPCGGCDPATESCGNTFGGSCKSDFQCNGDAIQCAVATATNKAECLLKSLYIDEENNPSLEAGKAALAQGTKALGTEGGLPVTEKSISALNRDNPFSSTCPADYPIFSYKGESYMLPLSNYCNVFQLMGQIMLVIAGLVSASIVLKGL